MSRTLMGPDLNPWDVYAAPGPSGFADAARLIFISRGVAGPLPRVVEMEGDRADAERTLMGMSSEELRQVFGSATPLA